MPSTILLSFALLKQWRVTFATDCCRVLSSAVLCYKQKLQNHKGTMADTKVTSITFIITTYQNRISEKSYVRCTPYGRATLGASDVPNKFFIACLFSDYNVFLFCLTLLAIRRLELHAFYRLMCGLDLSVG
jgi:hypothetical protein